jgi:hypothetical protein
MKNGASWLLSSMVFTGIASLSFELQAGDITFLCAPKHVMEGQNNAYVVCENSITIAGNKIGHLAISRREVEKASRLLSFATTALLSGKNLIAILPEEADDWTGCKKTSCRAPKRFGLTTSR